MVVVVPFPECRIVGVIACNHLLISDAYLWFLNVFMATWLVSPAKKYSVAWICHHFSSFLFAKGHLGYFQIWAIMSKTAVNIVQVSLIICFIVSNG